MDLADQPDLEPGSIVMFDTRYGVSQPGSVYSYEGSCQMGNTTSTEWVVLARKADSTGGLGRIFAYVVDPDTIQVLKPYDPKPLRTVTVDGKRYLRP